MNKKLLLIFILAFGLSQAQNVFRDDFAAYTTGANFSGSGTWSNSTSTGFPGTGGCSGSSCVVSKIVAAPLTFAGYGTATKGNELRSDSDGVGTFFTAIITPDIYVGMVVNLTSASATPQDHFRVFNNGSFISTAFRMFFKQTSGFEFQVGIAKAGSGNPIVYAPNNLSYGSDHLIILKFNQLPGNTDDVISVYLDPNYAAGQPATPNATNSALASASFVDQSGIINMMAFRLNSSANLPVGKTSLISVAKTWAELGFLPLATSSFDKSTFQINASQVKNGILNIKSSINLENAKINIYDIQGRMIENKSMAILENNNEILINPISNSGIYILEIVSGDKKLATKIAIQ
jgi:Secretion system C-terminal sorting domain